MGHGGDVCLLSLTASGVCRRHRVTGFPLERVVAVAANQIRQGHPYRVMLHLPDMAQLMDEKITRALHRPAQVDASVGCVPVEATEKRQTEHPGTHSDAYTVDSNRGGVKPQTIEAVLRGVKFSR